VRYVPLRSRLLLLAVAGILPLAVLSGVGLIALIHQQRSEAERTSLDVARALATAVDAELSRSIWGLEVLATSPQLDTGNTSAFEVRARRVLATGSQWRAIFLADAEGTVLMNASEPGGGDDTQTLDMEGFARVVKSRSPAIGQLVRDQRGEYGVEVHLPVIRAGDLRFILSCVVKPDVIREVISRQRVPENWVISVFDAKGLRVARSRAHEQFIGTPASPSLRQLMAGGAPEGTGFTYALEGDFIQTAYTRLAESGWSVAIGIAPTALVAGVYSSLAAFGGGIFLSIVLGVFAAMLVARSINRPIRELRIAAQALGRGELPPPPTTAIQEIQEVSDALVTSARQRAQGESERESLLAAERAARTAAEQARRRLELLATAGAVLSRSLEPQATLQAIASIMVPAISDWCRVDLLDSDGVLQRALAHHSDPDKARQGMELVRRLRAAAETPGSMAWTVATGKSHLAQFNPPAEFDAVRDRDLLTFAGAIGMRAYFIVPLTARGRTLGALAALQAESARHFSADDCALITELAQRAALALDNARLYAEAEAALREADKANRSKDEFLAMLGHELRNPLAPIVTALHLMAKRNDANDASERQIIERQVAHLSRLVDDLLDVSRITRGKIQLQHENVDLKAVVDRALELTQPLLETRARPITLELPAKPVWVKGDAVRLAQVLCNLLTNAAKFTPGDGDIALRISVADGWAETTVEDSGSGISSDLLPHVFDLFVQGRQPIHRNAGGLGLGLSIVKTLVHMHGGSVSAASDGTGRGSKFVVRLPLTDGVVAECPDRIPAMEEQVRGGRIMVVDDNMDAAETLAQMLDIAGYEVRTAADGDLALALLDTFVPALAILDIGLPGMSGYELARRLRADPRVPHLRLIALTGYGREPDRSRALAASFQEHLVKPVQPQRLLEAIRQLMDLDPGVHP
jgi:signal transduction histidine kinase/CheY-like chemotaxis protein